MERNKLKITKHAEVRMKQNGLASPDIERIIESGSWSRARLNREVYWIPDSPFLRVCCREIEHLRNIAVIVAEGNVVVSVYGRDERFRKGDLK